MNDSNIMKSFFRSIFWLLWLGTIYIALPADMAYSASQDKSKNKSKVSNRIEQLEFRDITVGDALRILSEQSDLNLIASKKAADVEITMFLRKVTPMEVIDAISKTYNLWYRKDQHSNIVRIYTVKEYRLEQVEFKNEITKIFTMKNAKNSLDLADTIQNLYGERVRLSFGNSQDELTSEIEERFTRFELIGEGGGGSGVGSNQDNRSSNNNSNFSRSSRSNVSNGQNRNAEFDEMMKSSSSVVEKSAGKDDAPGILLGNMDQSRSFLTEAIKHQVPIFVGVIKRQNRVLVRTRDADAMEAIRDLYKELDKDSSMLLLEVRVLQIDLRDGFNSLFDFQLKSGNAQLSTLNAHPQGNLSTDFVNNALKTSAAAFQPALLASLVSENFEARLELLEKENRITELSTQMLMTTNQEVSRIFVGQERPITTGFSSSVITSGGSTPGTTTFFRSVIVPDTSIRPIGTTLLLTPNINADKTVSLRLLIEQSTFLEKAATIPVPIESGAGLAEALVDVVNERTFSGTVVAQNKTSVAIGGLISEKSGDSETKVPILGDIPLLGFFFRETADTRERQELVVIIKPHIMSAPQQAESISNAFLQENSIHPKAVNANATLDMYTNNRRAPKGYELQDEYKLYDQQDRFDPYHKKGDLIKKSEPRKRKKLLSSSQEIYVGLTKYAAKSIRLPEHEREIVENILPVELLQRGHVDLFHDDRIKVIPVASWKQGGIKVTALEVHNISYDPVRLDYRTVKGRWLASSVEKETLVKRGEPGDSTYLYLISAETFDEIYNRILISGK